MFRKFIMLFCATMALTLAAIALITMQGCASAGEEPERTATYPHEVYGRDPYKIHCLDGEIWIVSDKHGRANIGIECTPQG